MADDKLAQKRNTGAAPVQAHPNHVREKTYDTPDVPPKVREEKEALPENTARDKLREEMPEAAHQVKRKLRKHG